MMTPCDSIWHGAYKIPWDDPDFSRRMLAEHLSQEHDLASRRVSYIDRQVAWIHESLLGGRPGRVLDLGCGPGFYTHRLTVRGHRCRGIDFGPASIEYAHRHNPDASRCEFVLGDMRHVEFGGPYDLAMVLYGEINVFSPWEALGILRNAHASLAPGGMLIIEVQTPQAIERMGLAEPSEQEHESGLFSDCPHRCRTENQWLSEQQITVQTFTVTESATGRTQVYRSTTKAWPDGALVQLLETAGFFSVSRRDDWPCNTGDLALWIAT